MGLGVGGVGRVHIVGRFYLKDNIVTLIKMLCCVNAVQGAPIQMALQEGKERSALLGLADGLAVP